MICKQLLITNKLGMHARAAAKFVNMASDFSSRIELERNDRKVNGKSIMGVMMLAAGKGSTVTLCIEGDDETEAADCLETLIKERFGENE